MKYFPRYAIALGLLAGMAGTSPSRADNSKVIMTITNPTQGSISSASFVGFQFTLDAPIYVVSLGLYLYRSGVTIGSVSSFSHSHFVGLFDADGTTLVASTTITAGSGALDGGLKFGAAFALPIYLPAGTYDLGAAFGASDSDLFDTADASATTGPDATYDDSLVNTATPGNNNFGSSPIVGITGGDFGPNMMYTLAPEPASLSLLAGGILVMGWARRRARARVAA